MELTINIILLLAGITILVWGANKFVDHASVIAKHLGVGDLVIGLTLIAAGTSAPEVFVGISAVLNGNEDIALGTAIGSNISNIALIFGVSCLYFNAASKTHLWNLMPFALTVFLLGLTLADGTISLSESMGFVGLFMLFMYVLMKTDGVPDDESSEASQFTKSLFLSMVGLVGLIAGANISIIYAESTALLLGISELIIGLTIIAIGTSLPELASSLMAVKKGEHDLAIGNVIGSNMFNTLAVVGIAGTIQPMAVASDFLYRDAMVMFASSVALFIFCIGIKRQGRLNRLEGGAFVLAYAAYTYWLIQAAFI